MQALNSHEISLGNLDSERDFTFVEDTCRGFIMAAAAKQGLGQVVNLGYGACISVGELVKLVGKILGKNLEVTCESVRLRPEKSEVERLFSDNSKAKQLLNWAPQIGLETELNAPVATDQGVQTGQNLRILGGVLSTGAAVSQPLPGVKIRPSTYVNCPLPDRSWDANLAFFSRYG